MEELFKREEIEDVRIIIKANGKNYAITPKKEFGKEVAKQMRLLCGDYALQMHDVVSPALEDIKQTYSERASADSSHESSGLNIADVSNNEVAVCECGSTSFDYDIQVAGNACNKCGKPV